MGREFICIPIFIIVCLLLIGFYFISRFVKHPPKVEYPVKEPGTAYVYLYDGGNRYRKSEYKKHKFVRNKKGKWKYVFENTKEIVTFFIIIVVGLPILVLVEDKTFSFETFGFFLIMYAVLAIAAFGGRYLLTLEPYIVLMRYLRKKQDAKAAPDTLQDNKPKNLGRIRKLFFDRLGMLFGIHDHSYKVPLKIAGKHKKYSPAKLLERLNEERNNVILFKDNRGQIRIYGNGDSHVLELRMGMKDHETVYHMINTDTDSIVPDTDKTPTVIENKWCEKLPVRKHWLVNENSITVFLMKLYTEKNFPDAMDGFLFDDTTEEVARLMEADAYMVPEVPVDRPIDGIESNSEQEWLKKKETRVQRALDILSKE